MLRSKKWPSGDRRIEEIEGNEIHLRGFYKTGSSAQWVSSVPGDAEAVDKQPGADMSVFRNPKYIAVSTAERIAYQQAIGADRVRRHLEIFYSGRPLIRRRPRLIPSGDATFYMEHPLMDGEIRFGFAEGEPRSVA